MWEAVGWASSLVLAVTITKQVYKQWRDRTSEGISKWLFVGQLVASVGFTAYSFSTRNWIFLTSNSFMVLTNATGLFLYFRFRDK